MRLEEFLEKILPAQGYRCWVSIKDKKVTQGFTDTTEELTAKLAEIDARGADAYFACASFATADNRRGPNAWGAKACWMDLDTKESKPDAAYDTTEDAIQACDEFCARYKLPFPGVVRSGGGAHVYWPFTRSLNPVQWRAVAERLKLLAASAGFVSDTTRTADIASILRPPGTHNYKIPGQPRGVEIDTDEGWGETDPIEFMRKLMAAPLGAPPAGGAGQPALNANLLGGLRTSKAFDPTVGVAQGCRGSTLLRYVGELIAKGYSTEDVTAKALAWNLLCAPPQDEAEVHRIIRSAWNMEVQKNPIKIQPTPPSVHGAKDIQTPPTAPPGYHFNPISKLLHYKVVKDDGDSVVTVTKYPVWLAAIMDGENATGQKENSYLFKYCHPKEGWSELTMSASEMWSAGWYGVFAERGGGGIAPGMNKLFLNYVQGSEPMLKENGETFRYNQFGWKDDFTAFLVGDVLLKNGKSERAYGTEKLYPKMSCMKLPAGGSEAAWSALANKFAAPGLDAHLFGLVAGFAAPLMAFCAGTGDAGAVLALVSKGSGTMKTPLTEAIASIWGDLGAVLDTGSSTPHTRHEAIVRGKNLPFVQDEAIVQQDTSITAMEFKRFTTGQDRGRMNAHGGVKGVLERFQTIMIATSNRSLVEIVRSEDEACSRRIFEVRLQRPDDDIFSNIGGVTKKMLQNRAYAGRRWAQILTQPGMKAWLVEQLEDDGTGKVGVLVRKYRDLLETDAEHRFIVWLLACVEAACLLLNHYGLMSFNTDRLMGWAQEQARKCMREAEIDGGGGDINRFIMENFGAVLVVAEPWSPGKVLLPLRVPQNHLAMRMEVKTKKLYIAAKAVEKWCLKNKMGYMALAEQLEEIGCLLNRKRKLTLAAGTELPSTLDWCWELDLAHPELSGQLREVEKAIVSAGVKRA